MLYITKPPIWPYLIAEVIINGLEPYIPVMATNAELTLEIGERVLENAKESQGYKRHHHKSDYGNLSIVASLRIKQQVLCKIPLFNLSSYIGNISIFASATPSGVEFRIKKNNSNVGVLVAKYPEEFTPGQHLVFIFSYCSRTKEARTIVGGIASPITIFKNIGWVHASDFSLGATDNRYLDILEKFYVLSYERLLSSEDSKDFTELPPNGYGLWKYGEELDGSGAFPE